MIRECPKGGNCAPDFPRITPVGTSMAYDKKKGELRRLKKKTWMGPCKKCGRTMKFVTGSTVLDEEG